MLTDLQLDILGQRLIGVYQELEQYAITDIARRVQKMGRYTETAELMAQSLQKLGYSPIQIQRQVLKALNADKGYQAYLAQSTLEYKRGLQAEINRAIAQGKSLAADAMAEASGLAFRSDLSLWTAAGKDLTKPNALRQMVAAMTRHTAGELTNLTRTAAFRVGGNNVKAINAYRNACDLALVKVTSGTASLQQAVKDVTLQFAKDGMKTVDLASGVSRSLDSAVRCCVQTASGQLAGQITQANIEATGVEHVEVSSHFGARPSHAQWQGQVYTLKEFVEVCGYGGAGEDCIYGYNCRHSHYPYWPGISVPNHWPKEPEPVTIDGKRYNYYEATQKQRRMERDIRATKRENATAKALGEKGTPESVLEAKKDAYAWFSEEAGIRPKWERTTWGKESADFDRIFGKEKLFGTSIGSGAKKTAGWENRHAKLYYEEVRNRATGVDANKIAKYTQFNEKAVEEIRQHVFIQQHVLDGGVERFAESPEMAQAWQRLTEGRGTKVDEVLLKHEYVELTQMRVHGYNYDVAHEIANRYHNWWSAYVGERNGGKR